MLYLIFFILIVILFQRLEIIISIENGTLTIYLKIFGFINYKLYPKNPHKAKNPNDSTPKKSTYDLDLLKILKKDIKTLISKSRISMDFECKIALSTADKTAIVYGIAESLLGIIDKEIRLYCKEFDPTYCLVPDFSQTETRYFLKINYSARIVYLLIFLIKFLIEIKLKN